ncbi:MAG: hypothetical protein HFJ40_04330 [Clostridia bacterium]|nr:hypothetical protein [Clostridia bacterium]
MKKYRKQIIKFIILVIITILLEITLFNFRYWQIKFSGLEEKIIDITQENIQYETVEYGKNIKNIEIDIDEKVHGIKLNIDTCDKENVVITTKFSDNSAKYDEKYLEDVIYNVDFKNSEYIVLNSMQECQKIKFTIKSGNTLNLDSITINTWYFDFNIYRVLLLIFFVMFFSNVKNINNYYEKNPDMKKVTYITIIGIIIISYIAYALPFSRYLEDYMYINSAIREDPYKMLTKSLVNGKVEIEFDDESRKLLTNLNNYQDYTERRETNVDYLFDFAFYNGNYYCYYGIVPVLTVLLPIAIIFKIYLSSNIICIIYSAMCIILFKLIYIKILNKYQVKLRFTTEIIGFLTLILSSGIVVLMGTANFYQAADLCGIAWGLFSIYLILLLENNQKINLKLFCIGLFYAMMVCSRPIYVLYIIPILICIFKYIIHDKKIEIKRFIVFAVPIIIIALAQMYYNYIRFDNVLEFGQFYNLTINNTADQKMDLGRSIEGTIAYLFNPPNFRPTFPFITLINPNITNGNIIYNENLLGIVWFTYFGVFILSKKIIKLSETNKVKWLIVTIAILAVIIFSVNTCLAGINQRYAVDIQPALSLLACAMWTIYLKNQKDNKSDFFEIIIRLSLIVTAIYMLTKLNYDLIPGFSDNYTKIGKVQYHIGEMFNFYK